MNREARLAERFRRVLESEAASSPGLRAVLGDGQIIEVAHVVADPLETLIFCRFTGGADPAGQMQGPVVAALAPEELLNQGTADLRWQDYLIFSLAPLYPHRRSIVLGFSPAPADRSMTVRRRHAPAAVLTVPVDPARGQKRLRAGRGGQTALGEETKLEVVSVAASETCAAISLWTTEPGVDLVGAGLRPPLLEPPAGAPLALWREAPPAGQGAQAMRLGVGQHRPLAPRPWKAAALPDETELGFLGVTGGGMNTRAITLRLEAPPAASTGLRIELNGAYRWEAAGGLAEIPAPANQEPRSLEGRRLAFEGGALELVAWEAQDTYFLLVTRPAGGFTPPEWPEWFPDLRLVLGEASVGLHGVPCQDGTFVFYVPREQMPADRGSVQLGLRAVGRRLPTAVLALSFD